MLWYGYCLLSLNPLYCLYVMSNTMYKDHGVFLFFFFFFLFLSCIITASNPCQSYRCPEDSACYHNDTHFTCVSHVQEDSNRKNGEIFSSTVIFQFSWCWSAIMLWYGYCLLSLNPLYCLYVMSNTMYKDHGVFLFFFFFFLFLSCIITASNPCQSYRCPEDSACYHNDTHFTCVSHVQEDSNRKNGEIFSSTVIFQFSWCWSAIMLWYGYCLLSLNPYVLRHLLKSYTSKVNKTL